MEQILFTHCLFLQVGKIRSGLMTSFYRLNVILTGGGVDFIPLMKYVAAENWNLNTNCAEIK